MATHKSVPFRHANAVYQALLAKADNEQLFTGNLHELWKSLGISNSYYTPVFAVLENAGCITRVKRGARNYPSVIQLNGPPIEEGWTGTGTESLTTRSRAATLLQRVVDIERQIGGIDIGLALSELAQEIEKLRTEVKELAKA